MLPKSRKSDYILPLSNNSNCGCKLENMNITKTISSYKGGGGECWKRPKRGDFCLMSNSRGWSKVTWPFFTVIWSVIDRNWYALKQLCHFPELYRDDLLPDCFVGHGLHNMSFCLKTLVIQSLLCLCLKPRIFMQLMLNLVSQCWMLQIRSSNANYVVKIKITALVVIYISIFFS